MAVATIISLVVLAGLVGLLLWESQYECVRWSTRIEVRKSGEDTRGPRLRRNPAALGREHRKVNAVFTPSALS